MSPVQQHPIVVRVEGGPKFALSCLAQPRLRNCPPHKSPLGGSREFTDGGSHSCERRSSLLESNTFFDAQSFREEVGAAEEALSKVTSSFSTATGRPLGCHSRGASLLKLHRSRQEPVPFMTCTARDRTRAAMPDSHASLAGTSEDHGRHESPPSNGSTAAITQSSHRTLSQTYTGVCSMVSQKAQAASGSEMAPRLRRLAARKCPLALASTHLSSLLPVQSHCEEPPETWKPSGVPPVSTTFWSTVETRPAGWISGRRARRRSFAHWLWRYSICRSKEERGPPRSTLKRISRRRVFHPQKDPITVRSGRASSAPTKKPTTIPSREPVASASSGDGYTSEPHY